jgi:hypothetical protein
MHLIPRVPWHYSTPRSTFQNISHRLLWGRQVIRPGLTSRLGGSDGALSGLSASVAWRGSADTRQSGTGVQADSQIAQRDDPHNMIVFDHR